MAKQTTISIEYRRHGCDVSPVEKDQQLTGNILDPGAKPQASASSFRNLFRNRMIVSEDGTRVLGPNEEGEIQASYPHRFIGYYANPEETAAFFTPDGFIQTGDIGRFDADGFLYITDRRKSMIRYRNFQIAPAQLEALIVELAGVSQAVVVGLPDPKVASNDLATALVVVRGSSVSAEEIVAHVDGRVPDYKRLRGGVFIVESLPRTGNDKIDRRRATKLARGLSQLC